MDMIHLLSHARSTATPGDSTGAKLSSAGLDSAVALKSFPDTLYPTVYGTAAERAEVYSTLDTLPMKDASAPDSVTFVGHMTGASGSCGASPLYHPITLARDQVGDWGGFGHTVLIHETGHAIDFKPGLPRDFLHPTLFGHAPYVQDPSLADPNYASVNRFEDYAQSYKMYHVDPKALQQQAPGKYQVMQHLEKETPLQRATDGPAFRATGKWMAQELGKIPFSRPILGGVAFMLGPVTVIQGVDQLQQGLKTANPWEKLQGELNVTTGALLTSYVAAPLALASRGALFGLRTALKRGDVSVADVSKLEGQKLATGSKTGCALKPAAVGVESGVGGLLGGLLTPLAAVPAAVAVGGPAAGAVALIGGGIAGFLGGSYLGERIAAHFTKKLH